jgi:hypothetical protein
LFDAVGWAFLAGVGAGALHGSVTSFRDERSIAWGIGASGAALIAPIIKDSVVGVVSDVIELLQRREPEQAQTQIEERDPPDDFVKESGGLTSSTGTWSKIPVIMRIKNGELTGSEVPRRATWLLMRYMRDNKLVTFPGEPKASKAGVGQTDYRSIGHYFCGAGLARRSKNNVTTLTAKGICSRDAWAGVDKPPA